MTISVRVLITEEDGVYNATCLEMGLAAAGPDLEVVKTDMVDLIGAHINACLEEGRPQDIFVPAPPEYWWQYAKAVTTDACHEAELPQPTAARKNAQDVVSHLDVRSLVCAH